VKLAFPFAPVWSDLGRDGEPACLVGVDVCVAGDSHTGILIGYTAEGQFKWLIVKENLAGLVQRLHLA